MDKNYKHKEHEEKIYNLWEQGGYFTPVKQEGKKPFTIIMPPPNANDPLHIGHARFVTIEDTLIRYHRMKGDPTLWLPGADHAGIETQFVFEKRLKEKGQSRFDFDRETLYKMIWDYVQENKSTTYTQLKQLGASCDWTREKFTLDPDIIKVVYKTFKKLHDDGLVYRSKRLVNYCTFCGTGYSNLEVDHVERTDPLYYIRYRKADSEGYIVVATTRPEPIFADTHLAVNPNDPKNKHLIGTKVLNPITDKEMDIIADEFVDPEFGTGIVKLTPAHDFNDFELAQKHNLPIIQAIDTSGKITNAGGKYEGLYIKQARQAVFEDLKAKDLIEKIDENYKHTIGICYRCKNVIEPMLMEQWFIKVEPLTKASLEAINNGKIKFSADKYRKIAIHWLENLKDWNISRQIVWGIRIPAWKCDECNEWIITDGSVPKECSCGSTKLTQEVDTFDTWFSSGQWPFATLMTTQPGDFEYFYPTSVMETGYDILPFWVLRMIMLGIYATGDIPFENVINHGLVRDAQGQKISKSKGNVINPLEMSDKYGTDALRMGLLWGALVENDVALSENNIRAQRNFANKLWNIARYILMVTNDKSIRPLDIGNFTLADNPETEVIADVYMPFVESNKKIAEITNKFEEYRLNEAAEIAYDYIWNDVASNIIENSKPYLKEDTIMAEHARWLLLELLSRILRVMHPLMPFITEELWQIAKAQHPDFFKEEALIVASWPITK